MVDVELWSEEAVFGRYWRRLADSTTKSMIDDRHEARLALKVNDEGECKNSGSCRM